MKTAVLIPTRGDRPGFIAQAKQMLQYQTLRPDKVYIVDAPGQEGVYDTDARTRVGIAKAIKDGIDRLFTWDDDEYYAPTYLEWLNSKWTDSDAIGVRNLPYYHLGYRRAVYREFSAHATNSCTAFVPEAVKDMDVRQTGYMFDTLLWGWLNAYCSVELVHQPPVPFQVIGMKHGVGAMTAGAHEWPAAMYELQDTDAHWLKANVHPDMVDFYLEDWKNG